MDSPTIHTPGARAWEIAKRDHDIISRRELLDLNFHPKAIRHRLRTRRLHRQARGVYSVGSPNLTKYGRWMVAIKRCGPDAVLSHLSAAVLWGLWKREGPRIEVTVPIHRNPQPEGIDVHRRRVVARDLQYGVPVTTPLQTLIDVALGRSRHQVERMINQADARNLLRFDTLREEIDDDRQPGTAVLRDILDRDSFVLSDSDLEQLFVPIALRAGLPKPESQVEVNGWTVDFYFPTLDLVVECDSLRYHRTPLQQKNDRLRDQAHDAADTPYVRFIHDQIAHEGDYVAKHLRVVAERLRRPARTPGRPRAA